MLVPVGLSDPEVTGLPPALLLETFDLDEDGLVGCVVFPGFCLCCGCVVAEFCVVLDGVEDDVELELRVVLVCTFGREMAFSTSFGMLGVVLLRGVSTPVPPVEWVLLTGSTVVVSSAEELLEPLSLRK